MQGNAINLVLRHCNGRNIAGSQVRLRRLTNDLVNLTGMKKLGSMMCEKGNDKLPGVSIVQMIETSHIAVHGFTNTKSYIVTIVSCKLFDTKKIKSYLKAALSPGSIESKEFEVNI